MHGADAACFKPLLDPEIEIRRIDANEHVRLPVEHALAEPLAQIQQARQVGQHFGQTHHREFVGIVPSGQSRLAHARAADAGKLGLREAFT